MRLALVVEYDGANYHGFQYQENARSIQEELERAIGKLTGEGVRIAAAGRTDAGVHARGQVVAFDTESDHPVDTFVRALNFHLPQEVAVRAGYRVGARFDPRRDARSRWYRYTIVNSRTRAPLLRRTACLVEDALDEEAMQEAAGLLIGTHDFACFAGAPEGEDASTVREIYRSCVSRDGEMVRYDVEGGSFLPRQVRRTAGALADVGRGRLMIERFARLLDGECSDAIAQALPAHGLCLMRVSYADFPPVEMSNGNEH